MLWKKIDNYEYWISDEGLVMNDRGMILKSCLNSEGYSKVALFKNEIRKEFRIHRLLGIAFIPNPDNKPMIDHIDMNRENNTLSNLRWATSSENCENTRAKHIRVQQYKKGKPYYQATIKRNGIIYNKSSYNKEKLEDWIQDLNITK
tara:strand:- start:67 stop:507 length:441 start_codon:yes stop_codon:yes gene_type:complete